MKNATPTGYEMSIYLSKYLNILKSLEHKKEQYELILTMILNKEYKKSLEILVEKTVKKMEKQKFPYKKIKLKMTFPKSYTKASDSVFASKYFVENYTNQEIQRKKEMSQFFLFDIIATYFYTSKSNSGKVETEVIIPPVLYPSISHTETEYGDRTIINLSFSKNTSLTTINKYLKDFLQLERNTKKGKDLLEKGIRLLIIKKEIEADPSKYRGREYDAKEKIMMFIYNQRFSPRITQSVVKKSLQRVRKIESTINITK